MDCARHAEFALALKSILVLGVVIWGRLKDALNFNLEGDSALGLLKCALTSEPLVT